MRGPWVAARYFDDDSDGEKFRAGWLRTGDIAAVDEQGFVQITDRSKDVIKSGGEWISSVELENEVMAHPDVRRGGGDRQARRALGRAPAVLRRAARRRRHERRASSSSICAGASRSGGCPTSSRSSTRCRRRASASSTRRCCGGGSATDARRPREGLLRLPDQRTDARKNGVLCRVLQALRPLSLLNLLPSGRRLPADSETKDDALPGRIVRNVMQTALFGG